MIIRSKIDQSFQTPWGFTLSVGDNVFREPLAGPVADVIGELRKLGLVECVETPAPSVHIDIDLDDALREMADTIVTRALNDEIPASTAPRSGPKKAGKRKGKR